MKQYINLYEKNKYDVDGGVNAITIMEVCLVVILVLFIITMTMLWQIFQNKNILTNAEEEIETQQQQIVRLKAKLDKTKDIVKDKTEYAAYEQKYKDMKNYLSLIREHGADSNIGFSEFFNGFAYNHIYGLAMKKIFISDYTRHIVLEGESLTPELVAAFLQKLEDDEVFLEVPYANLQVFEGASKKYSGFKVEIDQKSHNEKNNT